MQRAYTISKSECYNQSEALNELSNYKRPMNRATTNYQVTLARKIVKKPVIERKTSIREAARCGCKRHSGIGKRGKMPRLRVEHAAHCAPLERGNFGVSHSIHMSIRWIEEMLSD